jgi:hypothetical protein
MAASAELVVVGHQHSASLQLLELLGAARTASGSELHTWSVDNKYYRASIPCHATSTSTPADECQGCEAVVLVFDPRSQAAFKQVQAWWGAVEEQSAEIQLVVAVFEDAAEYLSTQPRQQWLQAAEDWCGEQMVEYVELCSSSPGAARVQGSEEGKQGLARLVEALQSHMWPSAEMRQQQGQQGQQGPAAAEAAAEAAEAGAQGSSDTKEQPDQEAEPDDDMAIDAFERLMGDMTGRGSERKGLPAWHTRPARWPCACSRSLHTHPACCVHSGPVVAGTAAARAACPSALAPPLPPAGARTRMAGMPDEKRRAAAAELALRMAAVMCGGDEEEEGLSDEGSQPDELRA